MNLFEVGRRTGEGLAADLRASNQNDSAYASPGHHVWGMLTMVLATHSQARLRKERQLPGTMLPVRLGSTKEIDSSLNGQLR